MVSSRARVLLKTARRVRLFPSMFTVPRRYTIADAWDTAALLAISPYFNAIYVDVGGISGTNGELEGLALVRQLICAFGKRFVTLFSGISFLPCVSL